MGFPAHGGDALPHAVRRRARSGRPDQWRDDGPAFSAGVILLRQQLFVGDRGDVGSGRLGHGQRQECSRATDVGSILQRGAVNVPRGRACIPGCRRCSSAWKCGSQAGACAPRFRRRSARRPSTILHTRNNGFNTGRAGQGIMLNWDDRSLAGIGIPGRIGKFPARHGFDSPRVTMGCRALPIARTSMLI